MQGLSHICLINPGRQKHRLEWSTPSLHAHSMPLGSRNEKTPHHSLLVFRDLLNSTLFLCFCNSLAKAFPNLGLQSTVTAQSHSHDGVKETLNMKILLLCRTDVCECASDSEQFYVDSMSNGA